jgi:hypothetical protein
MMGVVGVVEGRGEEDVGGREMDSSGSGEDVDDRCTTRAAVKAVSAEYEV